MSPNSWQTGGEISKEDLDWAFTAPIEDIVQLICALTPNEIAGFNPAIIEKKRDMLVTILQYRNSKATVAVSQQLVESSEKNKQQLADLRLLTERIAESGRLSTAHGNRMLTVAGISLTVSILMAFISIWGVFSTYKNRVDAKAIAMRALIAEMAQNLTDISLNMKNIEDATRGRYAKVNVLKGMFIIGTEATKYFLNEYGKTAFRKEDEYFSTMRLLNRFYQTNDLLVSREAVKASLEGQLQHETRFSDLKEVDTGLYSFMKETRDELEVYLHAIYSRYMNIHKLPRFGIAVPGPTPFIP